MEVYAGHTITAAEWDELRTGTLNKYAARITRSASQTIASGSGTIVQFSTIDQDPLSISTGLGTSSAKIVVPVTGWYVVSLQAQLDSAGSGLRELTLLRNGSKINRMKLRSVSAGEDNEPYLMAVPLAATDQMSVQVYQDSGGNKNLTFADLCVIKVL